MITFNYSSHNIFAYRKFFMQSYTDRNLHALAVQIILDSLSTFLNRCCLIPRIVARTTTIDNNTQH